MSASSTKALRELLLWARKEKIVLSSVTLQGVTVTVERDYGLQLPKGTDVPPEPKQSLYQQFGAALFGQAQTPAAESTNEPTVEDEDE